MRSGENFKIDICKTNKKFKTLFYKGLSEYNKVPSEEIKNVTRIHEFKERLLEFRFQRDYRDREDDPFALSPLELRYFCLILISV